MKAAAFPLLILLLCLGACSAKSRQPMPELTAAREVPGDKGCDSVFPKGDWQFIHAIDFALEDGSGSTVIGVTSLTDDSIACALTTVEGFTLFQAVYREGKGTEVQRAVPPFDKPAFAEGLMEDVRTIFLAPPVDAMHHGRTADRVPVCRYSWGDGRTTDIRPAVDGCWQIQTYSADHTMNRSVSGQSCRKNGDSLIPENLELRGFGHTNYTLKMTLIQADKINGKPLP